jgi:hypothetical protein
MAGKSDPTSAVKNAVIAAPFKDSGNSLKVS